MLSFPIDGTDRAVGPRELGDVVICPEHASDLDEATVHGVLHLCGYDHETDNGEMLALQAELTRQAARATVTRAGFVGLAGRPNVGKSTLVNAIVGAKVAIVSDRPQTTRRAIRGIATDPSAGWQMVLVDLPGVQRPRDSLTQRMQRRVERELDDADAALLVVDGHQGVGPGDRFIAKALLGAKQGTPMVCAVNKCDRLRARDRCRAGRGRGARGGRRGVPVSARSGAGLEPLTARLASLLPGGPFLYPPEDRSDLPSEVHLAELVREQVLRRTREEIPHAVEVRSSEIEPRDEGLWSRSTPRSGSRPNPRRGSWWARAGGWCARSARRRARSSSETSTPTCSSIFR